MIKSRDLVRKCHLLEKTHPYLCFAPKWFRDDIAGIIQNIIHAYRKNDSDDFIAQLDILETTMKERHFFDYASEEKMALYKCFLWSDNNYILEDIINKEWNGWKKKETKKRQSYNNMGKQLGVKHGRPIYEVIHSEYIKVMDNKQERLKVIEKYHTNINKKTINSYDSTYRIFAEEENKKHSNNIQQIQSKDEIKKTPPKKKVINPKCPDCGNMMNKGGKSPTGQQRYTCEKRHSGCGRSWHFSEDGKLKHGYPK